MRISDWSSDVCSADLFPNHQPRAQAMMIGIFHSAQDSFTGQIRTLMLDVVVTLVPAQSNDSDNAPDWRVLLGDAETGTEIGAGWNRTGARAGAFVAVQIDDPARSEERRVGKACVRT